MSLILQTMLSLCVAAGHISNQEMPFATKFAESQCGPRSKDPLFDSYIARALIPKEVYSQKNIESLFRWYLRKHERDSDMLTLEIYIEDKAYRAARICDPAHGAIIEPPLLVPGTRREEQEKYLKELEKQKLYSPVAIFSRGRKEFIIKPEYLNRYWWIPDLSKPDDGEIVDLKP
jgi:hypothetical protein